MTTIVYGGTSIERSPAEKGHSKLVHKFGGGLKYRFHCTHCTCVFYSPGSESSLVSANSLSVIKVERPTSSLPVAATSNMHVKFLPHNRSASSSSWGLEKLTMNIGIKVGS